MRRGANLIFVGLFCIWSAFATDAEGRISMFVVGCFTPEFQDIYDGDLDGYLLIGDGLGDAVDGSYLPRNYDNEIPDSDCDLPIRRSKDHRDFVIPAGTFFEVQCLLDNTSTFGGGPLDVSSASISISFDDGLIPYASSNPVELGNGRLTCPLGAIGEGELRGTAVRFFASEPGTFSISARVSTNLVDPNNANNVDNATIEVVAPQTDLVFPWISSNAQFDSQIVINNLGDEDALVWCSAVRQEGDFLARPIAISPRGFLRTTTAELFPDLGQGSGYSIRVISTSPNIRGRWVTFTIAGATGNSPSQGVAVARPAVADDAKQRSGQSILFGYLPISPEQFSAPVILNLGDNTTNVTLEFFNAAGDLLLTDTQTLTALETIRPFATVANNLLEGGMDDVALIATSSGEPLTGVGFVFNQAGEPSIGNVSGLDNLPDAGGTAMVLPWISNNAAFGSTLVINNLSDLPADVELLAQRGFAGAETVQREIPPGGFLNESAASLFPGLGEGSGYTVLVTSDTSRLAGRWVTDTLTTASAGSPSQGVGIRLDGSDDIRFGKHVLFGYLPLTGGFTSAPVIVNVGDEADNVVLRFYDRDGNLVETTVLNSLLPFRPFAAVANDLVPGGSGDVYMVASGTDEPVTGVAFVFNSGGEPAIGNVTSVDFVP